MSNIVRDFVNDMNKLMDESDELRNDLMARGVQTQTINVLVEMGFHDQADDDDALLVSAIESARKAHGQSAITRQELVEQLDQLVVIEKDIAQQRRSARQRGLDLQALNFLARAIRHNPGDGGVKSVNTFLGYAKACDIELSGIEQVAQECTSEPESVLPQITRESRDPDGLKRLCRDVTLGVCFTLLLMALMVG